MTDIDTDADDIALEEWKALRTETLQSQNQRFTAFQVSLVLFAVLYGAYLAPQSGLRSEPIFFQAILVGLLVPFVGIVGGLRLRDYMQACYTGNFIQPKVGSLRYTQRQNAIPRSLRNRISSANLIQQTYTYLVFLTTPLTLGYGYVSAVGKCYWYERLSSAGLPGLAVGIVVLAAAIGFFLKVKRSVALGEDIRNEIFDAVRRVMIRELLSSALVPKGWSADRPADPRAWETLFAPDSTRNKKMILKELKALEAEYPFATPVLNHLRIQWGGSV